MPRPLREVIEHQDEIADWFETEGPSPDDEMPVVDYFLGLLVDVRDLGAEKVCGAVELARGAGASWQQIGRVLELSGSAAQRQFDRVATRSASSRREVQPREEERLGLDL